METIVLRLNGLETAVLMNAIVARMEQLATEPLTQANAEEITILCGISEQAHPQTSKMAERERQMSKHQQN